MIPFVFQNWSLQYNWWIPNNCPADFIIDGKHKLPFSHDWMYFDHGPEQRMLCSNNLKYTLLPALKNEMLHNYRDISFVKLDEFKSNKYIYPIFIRTWDYFLRMDTYGFKFVSQQVKDDVRHGLAKIVIIHPWEGPCGYPDWDILNKWVCEEGFKKDQVHFIHGNFQKPDDRYNFSYHPVSYFQMSWDICNEISNFVPIDNANLFLSYNRATRKHRTLLICELMRSNIFDRGIISYYNPSKNVCNLVKNYGREDLIESGAKVEKLLPLNLEYDLANKNPAHELNHEHHARTFLSLVTETLTEDEVKNRTDTMMGYKYSPLFFSEKTWKPISIGQPFIIIASKGHLQLLKQLGYKTFDRWWSEEYDTVDDINVRLTLVMQELVRLSQLSASDLLTLRKEMEPNLTHNQKIYNDFRIQHLNQPWEPSYGIIKNIWDSF